MTDALASHSPGTVKIDGKPYVLATLNGKPAYASGTRIIQQVPSDDFEKSWEDFSGGLGVDYYACNNFLAVKNRLFPRQTVGSYTLPVELDFRPFWSFEAKDSNGLWYLFLIGEGGIAKFSLSNTAPVFRQFYRTTRTGNASDHYGSVVAAVDSGSLYWYIAANNGDRILRLPYVVAAETGNPASYATAATLNGDINASVTSIVYTSAGDPISADDLIYIDNEAMYVVSVNTGTNTLTVTRAQCGTTAASHTDTTEIKYKAGDTFTAVTSVIKGAAHLRQMASGQIVRSTSSHSAGTFQNRAEISLLVEGTDFQTDANWGEDFPVGSQTTWIIGLMDFEDLIVVGKQDGWFVAEQKSDGSLKWKSLLLDSIIPESYAIGQAVFSEGAIWNGRMYLPTPRYLRRSTLGSIRAVDPEHLFRLVHEPKITGVTEAMDGYVRTITGMGDWLVGLYETPADVPLMILGRERHEADDSPYEIVWQSSYKSATAASTGAGKPVIQRNSYLAPSLWWAESAGTGTEVFHYGVSAPSVPGTVFKYMRLAPDMSPYRAGTLTYGEASMTAWVCPMPVVLPSNVLFREVEYVIENGSSNATWSFHVFDPSSGSTQVGGTLTATGTLYWTAGTVDQQRKLMCGIKCALAAGYAASATPPTLLKATVRGHYIPDVSEDIVFTVDVAATATATGRSRKDVVSDLETAINSGALAWVDNLGATGYVLVKGKQRDSFIKNASLISDQYVHVKVLLLEYS